MGGGNTIVALILYLFPSSDFFISKSLSTLPDESHLKKKWLSKRERKREVDSLLLSNKWKRNVFCYPLARHETARNAGAWPPDRCHGEYNDWCCCYIVGRMALSVCPNTLFPDSIGQRCWIGFSQVVLQGSSTEKAKGVSSFINFQLLGTKQIKIDEVIE